MSKCQDMAMAAMQNGNHSMYESVALQYETYETEYQERLTKKSYEEHLESNPDGTIEIGSAEDISHLRRDNGIVEVKKDVRK